jgi:hypothetical protein
MHSFLRSNSGLDCGIKCSRCTVNRVLQSPGLEHEDNFNSTAAVSHTGTDENN